MQKVEVFGEVPLARFGHTITQGNHFHTHFPDINLAYSVKIEDRAIWWRHWRHREIHNYR